MKKKKPHTRGYCRTRGTRGRRIGIYIKYDQILYRNRLNIK